MLSWDVLLLREYTQRLKMNWSDTDVSSLAWLCKYYVLAYASFFFTLLPYLFLLLCILLNLSKFQCL